ncbi:MAG TPA: tetratricopeptide repeat protein, partial [Planctomycetota bacterium]|nr:tetratricopeptide repeat protein [Planctomycetota bacterium]
MSSPRERKKARRRAERTMDEAWEAVLQDRLPFAEKLARRAIDGSEMNPRLWLDLGRILYRCGQPDDAEEALRRALALAPPPG